MPYAVRWVTIDTVTKKVLPDMFQPEVKTGEALMMRVGSTHDPVVVLVNEMDQQTTVSLPVVKDGSVVVILNGHVVELNSTSQSVPFRTALSIVVFHDHFVTNCFLTPTKG